MDGLLHILQLPYLKKKDLVSSLLQHCHEDNYVNFLNLYKHVGIEQLTDEPSKNLDNTHQGKKKNK